MDERRLHDTPLTITGPLRHPRQMLAEQTYAGHTSLHDDATAAELGLRGAPIEGPTHFSQFAPALATLWGPEWFERGCASAHYQQMVVEGDEVRAAVDVPFGGARSVTISAAKADGSSVLTGSAHVGEPDTQTECERRLEAAAARPPERIVILDRLSVGQKGREPESVRMGFDDHLGDLYPFTLAQKLKVITEPMPWYEDAGAASSPWGRPIIPMEMISVLASYNSRSAGFEARQPSIGLFLDQEIRLLDAPLFVDEDYVVEREVVALSESRRTESYWTRVTISRTDGTPAATMLLHQGVFKESYPGYPKD